MNKWYSYLNSAQNIINLYDGKLPFHHFIKQHFKQFKKYGSKDRKWIAHLCYCNFRMGHALKNETLEIRILAAHFLTTPVADELLACFKPSWHTYLVKDKPATLRARINVLQQEFPDFNAEAIFPYTTQLGAIKDPAVFTTAHLIQPDVFLRIRADFGKKVTASLLANGIPFRQIGKDSLVIATGTALEHAVALNKEVVIQDLSSQKVAGLLELVKNETKGRELAIWDCCAASGGKTILAYDVLGENRLVVSDIRTSILKNLLSRLKEAELGLFDCFATDLAVAAPRIPLKTESIDLVIADVPCSGSGTWSRTPEMLLHFDARSLEHYTQLQKKIVNSVLPYLTAKGYLLYITCSVFKAENEAMINYLTNTNGLQLVQSAYFEGYEQKADTLFAALLRNTIPASEDCS